MIVIVIVNVIVCVCVQALMRALYQVSDAMAYLVSRNVVHRDLALRLVNADVE